MEHEIMYYESQYDSEPFAFETRPLIDLDSTGSTYYLPAIMLKLTSGDWIVVNLQHPKTKVVLNAPSWSVESIYFEDTLSQDRGVVKLPVSMITGFMTHPSLINCISKDPSIRYPELFWLPDITKWIEIGRGNMIILPKNVGGLSFENYRKPYSWMTVRGYHLLQEELDINAYGVYAHYNMLTLEQIESSINQRRISTLRNPLW